MNYEHVFFRIVSYFYLFVCFQVESEKQIKIYRIFNKPLREQSALHMLELIDLSMLTNDIIEDPKHGELYAFKTADYLTKAQKDSKKWKPQVFFYSTITCHSQSCH